MSSSTYRKNVTREDPRLARRESSSLYDDLEGKSKGNNRDPRIRDEGWHRNENYGQQQMQTAYQHLPPSIYSDVSVNVRISGFYVIVTFLLF